jgi:hypothetical protein
MQSAEDSAKQTSFEVEDGFSVKEPPKVTVSSVRTPTFRDFSRLRESTATRMINANGRYLKIAVAIMLLALSVITASTLVIVFTRDVHATSTRESDAVSAQRLGHLTDQGGKPISSGETLYEFPVVSADSTVPAAARNLVDYSTDADLAHGVFGDRAHLHAFLATIKSVKLDLGTIDKPISLGYHVEGYTAENNHVTLKMHGATGDLDLHLLKDEDGTIKSTFGDASYYGNGTDTCPYCSPQEQAVCDVPGVICAEMGNDRPSWQRRTPSAFANACRRNPYCRRRLEDTGTNYDDFCARCVRVPGAVLAGGVAGGVFRDEIW